MPKISDLTGLPLFDGPDFNSTIPVTDRQKDAALAMGMVTVPCANVTERDKRFPSPGLNQRPVVRVGDETHRWDGSQWLIFDDKPKSANFYMYSLPSGGDLLNMNMDPDGSGDGGGRVFWKRDGHFVDWRISVVRGADSNVGGGTYVWLTPFAVKWEFIGDVPVTPSSGLSGMVVQGYASYPCGVYWLDSTHPILVRPDGTRVGTSSFSWGTGDSITLGGRSRIGGLL